MRRRLSSVDLAAKASGRQPESIILASIRGYLKIRGYFVVRIQQGIGCHKGVSDLVAMRAGRTVWIEVKSASGRLSADQEIFRADVLNAGGEYLVARSVDDVIGAGL